AGGDATPGVGASVPGSPASGGPGSHAAGSHTPEATEAPETDGEAAVDDQDDEDDAVITDHDPVDTTEVESEDEGSAAENAPDEAADATVDEARFSGSHRAEEPPTTALDLDEVRQLRIERGTDSSS
ncbi:MAG: hypothetical protein MOP51_2725, partial [Citricoccus sp.]|nr:hypothetical protein [Citricoccus sp. WCRC_4]